MPPLDSVRILGSLGTSNIIMKCAVIDLPTTALLVKSGATVQEPNDYVCFSIFLVNCLLRVLQLALKLLIRIYALLPHIMKSMIRE